MATFDQTLNGKNSQKKSISVSSATIDFGAQNLAIADVVSVFTLPADAVVTNAFFYVQTGVAGVTSTGKITVGTTDVVAAVAFAGTAGAVKGGAVTKAHTGTGSEVTITIGTAAATAGVVEVVVEYIEYTKTSGELTNI